MILTKKNVLGVGALVSVVLAVSTLTGCGSDSSKSSHDSGGGKLVVASWGGSFSAATKEAIADPFSKDSGVDVKIIDAPLQQMAQLEAQQKSGKVTWDIIDSLDETTVQLMIDKDMLEKLPAALKSKLEKVSGPGMVTDYGIMQTSISLNVTCNREKAKKCPTTGKDFLDIKNFPGDRVLYDDPVSMLYFVWGAEGNVPEEPTPADVDRAFNVLESIKPAVKTYWQSGDESEQVFRNGDVVMGLIGNGRIPILMKEGIDLVSTWDAAVYHPSYNVIPKGAPNLKAAKDYLASYAKNTKGQARFADLRGNGVASLDAQKHMDKMTIEWLPENAEHVDKLVHVNNEWWSENRKEIVKRWRSLISS